MLSPTTAQYLASLTSLYTPPPTQFDGARRHKNSIRTRLDQYLGLFDFFETGSLRHGTGVRWYSDADYMAVLKGVQPGSENTALTKVKEQLQLRYPQVDVVIRKPAVVVRFSDGIVEVTPAYPLPSGEGYNIPDPTGGWMKSHPKHHNTYVLECNKKLNGAAKKLARQAKIWKYERSVPLSSCYLEMRAARFTSSESEYVPVVTLHKYFKHLLDSELASLNDPTGMGSRFNATSSETKHDDAMSKLARAAGRAYRARSLAADGKSVAAIEQLKLVFDQP